jgi:hypothetical protein
VLVVQDLYGVAVDHADNFANNGAPDDAVVFSIARGAWEGLRRSVSMEAGGVTIDTSSEQRLSSPL